MAVEVCVRFPVRALTKASSGPVESRLTKHDELGQLCHIVDHQTCVVRFYQGGSAPVHRDFIKVLP